MFVRARIFAALRVSARVLVPAVAVLCLVACSDSATGASAPVSDGGSSDGAVGTTKLAVVYKGASTDVDVGALSRQDYRGSQVVSLTKVWDAAKLGADLAKVQFDFEGDDGFRPSSKDRCKTPITGAQIEKGYILPDTRTLVWDDALGLPGCYSVKLVAKVLVADAP